MFRERLNLSVANRHLLANDEPAAPVVHPVGGPFAVAWRNYMKSVFQKSYMYRLSCQPSVVLYVAENKTLGGKEDRIYDGEALGRKLVIVFFEDLPGHAGLVRRVNRESLGLKQVLLSIAELLKTIGGVAVPDDPERPAAQTELLFERLYEDLEIQRFTCTAEPGAPEPIMFQLDREVDAEQALTQECPADHRTKMILARCLQRNQELLDEENLQGAWNQTLVSLRARSAHHFPVPAAPPAPAAPAAPAPAGRGRGRGGGRGRGPAAALAPVPAGPLAPAPAGPLAPAPAPALAPAPAGRGRGRGRAGPGGPAAPAGRARGRGGGRGG